MVSFDLECGRNVCNSYFWYIKILVSILRRDFCLISARFFGCQFLGFERYRLNIRDPLTVEKESVSGQFQCREVRKPMLSASERFSPRGHSGPRQTADEFKSVHFHFLFQLLLWSHKTEFPKKNNRKFFFLVQLWKIVIFRQIADWNKILFPGHRKKIDKFRFEIEYKIFSFDFRRKFRVEKKIFES